MIVIPIIYVLIAHSYVKDHPDLGETMKIVIAVGPALVFMNLMIGIYIYKAIHDPENYTVDPPMKIKAKK